MLLIASGVSRRRFAGWNIATRQLPFSLLLDAQIAL